MNQLILDMCFILQTPLHTTGNRWLWGADKASALSAEDLYMIPATSLKGLLRANAEAILKTWNLPVCQTPEPGNMCSNRTSLCLVCKVFGNPRFTAPLKFSDAKPPPGEVETQIRSGVSMSRYRRVVLPQRLFFIETVQSQSKTEWIAQVAGCFPTPQGAEEAAALIYLAMQASNAIGGGRSQGLGWIKSWRFKATLDNQSLSEAHLQPIWQTWSRGR